MFPFREGSLDFGNLLLASFFHRLVLTLLGRVANFSLIRIAYQHHCVLQRSILFAMALHRRVMSLREEGTMPYFL